MCYAKRRKTLFVFFLVASLVLTTTLGAAPNLSQAKKKKQGITVTNKMTKGVLVIREKKKLQLKLKLRGKKVSPKKIKKIFKFRSSNKKIVTVNKKGKIYDKLGYGKLVKDLYKMDTTEIIETDNLFSAEEIIKDSQDRASKIFKSGQSYYLVNGSTCGIQAAIWATCKPKSKILINRDCHQSAINAFILGDVEPVYIKGSICENTYTIQGVSEQDVISAIDNNEDIKAKGYENHRKNNISLIFQNYNLIDYLT